MDIERAGQHLQHFGGQFDPGVHGRTVQAHEVAVRLPGRHLLVHLLHCGGEVPAQGRQVQAGVGIHTGGPARAHGRAVQGGALADAQQVQKTSSA